MGGEDRGTAMAASLVRAGRSAGMPLEDVATLSRAHTLAMAPRVAALDDDHHPLYLHPGRSALILLRDVGTTDPRVLSGALLTESEDEPFRIPGSRVAEEVGEEVARLVSAVPSPGDEDLAEALVVAEEAVRLVALAERLDHLRHAHLREADPGWGRRIHQEAVRVYQPVAHRTHPRLAQRYDHWCRTFAVRLDQRRV